MSQRTLTIRFVGDSKNMSRAVKDIVSGLDDTESAGKRVAGAMKQLAGDAEASFRDSRDAADRLAAALGPEMVAQIEAGGRSVDGYITDLQRMGLTFDDIRTDVDELADAIRRVDTTRSSIEGLKAPLKDVDANLNAVRTSGDQSRAVLGSMVGGSAADLAGLGGVAGTLASTLDQMTSYAVEGQFSLKNLASIAGPMVGVGVAVAGVSWAMGKLKAASEKAKKEAELMLGVHEKIRDGKFEDAAGELAESYGDLVRSLSDMGVPQDEVMQFIIGASNEMPTFNRLLEENKVQFAEGGEGLTDFGGKLNSLATDVYGARDAFAEQAGQLRANDKATRDFEAALKGVYDPQQASKDAIVGTNAELTSYEEWIGKVNKALSESEKAHERAKKAQDNAREAAQKRLDTERELYGFLLSQVDANRAYEVAVDAGEDAIRSFDEVLGQSKSTLEEIDDAARNSADQLFAQADAFAASKGAADGSKESIRLQIEELYRLASTMDPKSPLRARLLEYIGELQRIPPTIDTMLRLRISQGSVTTRDGDLIGQRAVPGGGIVAGATGGIVTRPTMALIGEAGPEAVIPLDSLPGNMPLSAVPGGIGGVTNVTHVYITQEVPPTADIAAIGRASIEAILAAQRQSGDVFQLVRG